MKAIHEPVVIVGGGPAGLSAAAALAPHSRVLVLERESVAGGIPRHCNHTGFGLRDLHRSMKGPAYSQHLLDAALRSGAQIMTNAMVTGWAGAKRLEVTSPQGRILVSADAIVLATGARERPRAARRIPGDRAAGIYNTGQLQQLVHLQHQRVGSRAVVVGSELVSWSAVLTLKHAGCQTVMVTTEYPKPDTHWIVAASGRLWFRPKLRTSTRIVRVIGRGRVSGVEIEHLLSGHREIVACDTVVFTGDWIPDNELVRSGGINLNSKTLGPTVDAALCTETPGIFAAGNLIHPVDTGDVAALDGTHVASSVLSYLRHDSVSAKSAPIEVTAPLRWVAPSVFRADGRRAARGRLLLWSDAFIRFPTITVHQAGRVIATKRMLWPAAPGRVFHVPWSVLRSVSCDGGAIEISVR